jgi:hypothetical protein
MRAGLAILTSLVIVTSVCAPVRVSAQKPPDALDSIDAEWSGVQTDLLEVKRMSDNTVRVRWRWRNTSDQKITLFSTDQAVQALKQESYLIDPANKKKHLAVTDSKGKVVGTALGFTSLKPKETLSVWAKFPAPPAGVDKITVVIAKTPPFEDVVLK